MKIYELLWFESYLRLGSVSEVESHRIGLFKFKKDAKEEGDKALAHKYRDLIKTAYHYESTPGGARLIFRSNTEGYEEHCYQYRIDEVELQ